MPLRPRPVLWAVLTASLICPAHAEPPSDDSAALRLVATHDGRTLTPRLVKGAGILLADTSGELFRPAHTTRWSLEGDVRAHAALFHFSPNYRIATRTTDPFAPDHPAASFATVRLTRSWQWTAQELYRAVAVFVWFVDGKPTTVIPLPTRDSDGPSSLIVALALFELDARSVKGWPAILLWKDGTWIAPEPRFAQQAERTAFHALFLEDDATFDAALTRLRKVDARSNEPTHWRLLDFAAEAGRTAAVESLIKHGAEINARGAGDYAALHAAALNGRLQTVEALLRAGAKRAPVDVAGNTPFELAIVQGHLDTALQLMPEKSGGEYWSDAVGLALRRVDAPAIEAILTRQPTRFLKRLTPEATAALFAFGDVSLVNRLVAAGMPKLPQPSPAAASTPAPGDRIFKESELTQTPRVIRAPAPEVIMKGYESDGLQYSKLEASPMSDRNSTTPSFGVGPPLAGVNHWAAVSFVIERDGTVSHIVMIDANSEPFMRSAEQSVNLYTFEPGRLADVPVRTRVVRAIAFD